MTPKKKRTPNLYPHPSLHPAHPQRSHFHLRSAQRRRAERRYRWQGGRGEHGMETATKGVRKRKQRGDNTHQQRHRQSLTPIRTCSLTRHCHLQRQSHVCRHASIRAAHALIACEGSSERLEVKIRRLNCIRETSGERNR